MSNETTLAQSAQRMEDVRRVNMIETYKRESGGYDWRAIGGNGSDIVATSGGQGYEREMAAIDAADRFGPQGFGILRGTMIIVQPSDRGYVRAMVDEYRRQGQEVEEFLRQRIIATVRKLVDSPARAEAIAEEILSGRQDMQPAAAHAAAVAKVVEGDAQQRPIETAGERAEREAKKG